MIYLNIYFTHIYIYLDTMSSYINNNRPKYYIFNVKKKNRV